MLGFKKITSKDMNLLKRALQNVKAYKWGFTLLILCILLNLINELVQPLLSAKVITNLISNNYLNILYFLAAIVALYLVSVFFSFSTFYLRTTTQENITLKIKKNMFNNILNLPIKAFENMNTGEFVSRVSGDSSIIGDVLVNQFVNVIVDIIKAITICVIVFRINVILAMVTLVSFPISSYVYKRYGHKIRKENEIYLKTNDKFFSKLQQSITGIREIRSLGIKNTVFNEFSDVSTEIRAKKVKIGILNTISTTLSMAIGMFSYVAIICIGSYLVLNNKLKLEYFIAFNSYAGMFSASLMNISQIHSTIQKSLTSLERIYKLLDNLDYPANQHGHKKIGDFKGEIQLNNVSFSYDNATQILKNINITVKKNKKVAIVGLSGSGKSTIFNLILRFYDPNEGSILLDNTDLKEVDEEFLRECISVVRQDPFLFKASIKENLLLANPAASDEEMYNACRAANIHDYISNLDNKYDSVIGENGVNLSGGQKQRIAIARTMLKKSKIILFDEATSSLDNDSQHYIKKSIDKLAENHTVLIIAHRLSTILEADEIIVINDGEIVGMGKHSELIKDNIHYKGLYENEIELIEESFSSKKEAV